MWSIVIVYQNRTEQRDFLLQSGEPLNAEN
jgi:hypothetical protein